MSIQPLPRDVIAQIKSSTTITSLNGAVYELMKNSLDAGSTKISINVDYARGGCVVEDDGLGIVPSEFVENGGLGKLYHSSKLNSENIVHGYQGTFLASLSAMALISITSHHQLYRSHNTLSMHKSEVISRQTPAPPQHYLSSFGHGTRVTVRDLFGSMPVRVKQRAIISERQRGNAKEWEDLKRQVVLLLLSWPGDVSVTIREIEANQKMAIRLPCKSVRPLRVSSDESAVCDILSQAGFIAADEKSSWVSVGASIPNLEISGTISLEPSATKNLQFLAFGIQPFLGVQGRSILHEEINRLFLNSNFGNEEESDEIDEAERRRRANDARYKGDGFTNKELKGGKKGVDRWPMFYINIQRTHGARNSRRLNVDGILDDEENHLNAIFELLHAMILAFLTKHHFRPRAARGHRSSKAKGHYENGNERESQDSPTTGSHNALSSASPTRKLSEQPNGILKHTASGQKPPKGRAIDPLGTNFKLPSFRQLSRYEIPFDGWSRMKSGATRTGSFQQDNGLSDPAQILRPSTAPPSLRTLSPVLVKKSYTSGPSQRSTTPLISESGKLTRPPFDEVIAQKPPSQPWKPQVEHVAQLFGDDTTIWVNPITKVKSVVNTRTGLTIPENRAKSEMTSHAGTLSRPRLTSRQSSKDIPIHPSPWISGLLKNWDNPVFEPTEPSIPQVSFEGARDQTKSILHGGYHHCSQIDIDRAFKESSAGINGRISKDALKNAEVVSQVDKKFILVKVDSVNEVSREQTLNHSSKMLVIIDQHAADERIRIESLMEELCTPSTNPESIILTTSLDKPLIFEMSLKEINLLCTHKQHFVNWGIIYDLPDLSIATKSDPKTRANSLHRLVVQNLPPGIMERCKLDPRLLIELIRTEAWKIHESNPHSLPDPTVAISRQQTWLEKIHSCPQGIIDMLNSRACRSAIMFNDELGRPQCEVIVKRLAKCRFPFQCAHGRPSLVPLVDLGRMAHTFSGEIFRNKEESFGSRFRKWRESLAER